MVCVIDRKHKTLDWYVNDGLSSAVWAFVDKTIFGLRPKTILTADLSTDCFSECCAAYTTCDAVYDCVYDMWCRVFHTHTTCYAVWYMVCTSCDDEQLPLWTQYVILHKGVCTTVCATVLFINIQHVMPHDIYDKQCIMWWWLVRYTTCAAVYVCVYIWSTFVYYCNISVNN
jgi:hypothetical protein